MNKTPIMHAELVAKVMKERASIDPIMTNLDSERAFHLDTLSAILSESHLCFIAGDFDIETALQGIVANALTRMGALK